MWRMTCTQTARATFLQAGCSRKLARVVALCWLASESAVCQGRGVYRNWGPALNWEQDEARHTQDVTSGLGSCSFLESKSMCHTDSVYEVPANFTKFAGATVFDLFRVWRMDSGDYETEAGHVVDAWEARCSERKAAGLAPLPKPVLMHSNLDDVDHVIRMSRCRGVGVSVSQYLDCKTGMVHSNLDDQRCEHVQVRGVLGSQPVHAQASRCARAQSGCEFP